MYTSAVIMFKDLVLDKNNPRFITNTEHKVTQRKILEYLIEFEFVIELAESIQNFGGLVPGERLLVMQETNGKYIVLEGNRRTAAISLLLNPQKYLNSLSLKTRDRNRINEFVSSVDNKLKKQLSQFEVDTVANRDDAIYSLAERHIEGIRTWSPISKMYFYRQHFDSGKKIDEIKKYSPESTRTITDFLRKYSFFRFVLNSYKTYYPNGKYSNTEFETTIPTELIIQRIFNSLKDPLEIEFNPQTYQMVSNKYNKDQYELLSRIFADISYLYWDQELINTRNLNTVQDFQDVFFNHEHTYSSEESIAIGKLINELENSLKKSKYVQKELELYENEESEVQEEPKPDNNDDNEDVKRPTLDDNYTKEDQTVPNTNKSDDNEDNEQKPDSSDDVSPSGRLWDPITYMYLTGAFPIEKNYKKNSRINTLKIELGSLKYKEYKLSSMFLIRSLLETYTHVYIDLFSNLPHDNPLRMKHIARQRKDRRQSLRELLTNHIYQHLKDVIKNHAETYELIQTTFSENNNTALTQIINHHIHSTNNVPDKKEILNAWQKAVIIINTLDKILFTYGQDR